MFYCTLTFHSIFDISQSNLKMFVFFSAKVQNLEW